MKCLRMCEEDKNVVDAVVVYVGVVKREENDDELVLETKDEELVDVVEDDVVVEDIG